MRQEHIGRMVARRTAFQLDPKPWVTSQSQEIPVCMMKDSHIEATLNMLRNGRTLSGVEFTRKQTMGIKNADWIIIFEDELGYRAWTRLGCPKDQTA